MQSRASSQMWQILAALFCPCRDAWRQVKNLQEYAAHQKNHSLDVRLLNHAMPVLCEIMFSEKENIMAGLFGVADSFGTQVKKLFKPGEILIGNLVFALHHQWSFVIVIVGLIFSTSNNYLNKDAMICHGGSKYVNNFCFLHGSAHVPKVLQEELSSSSSCVREDEGGEDQDNIRTTHYYIWLPFVLAIVAIITKLPWILWKNILERGLMKKLVADMDQDGSKTAKRVLQVSLCLTRCQKVK